MRASICCVAVAAACTVTELILVANFLRPGVIERHRGLDQVSRLWLQNFSSHMCRARPHVSQRALPMVASVIPLYVPPCSCIMA